MGLNNIERQAERSLSHRPIKPVQNRAKAPAVAIFLRPVIEHNEKTMLHCFFCGHPFAEVRNQVMYVSTYGGHFIGKVAADEVICKRCKQRYIKIV